MDRFSRELKRELTPFYSGKWEMVGRFAFVKVLLKLKF